MTHVHPVGATLLFSVMFLAWGCASAPPATDVQIVEKGAQKVYVAGAAGPGINKKVACGQAVKRSVNAIADRFADENGRLADALEDQLGIDGRLLLARFARDRAQDAAVQDLRFNPVEHTCLAAVRWTPPMFVRDAVLKYGQALRERELGAAGASDR